MFLSYSAVVPVAVELFIPLANKALSYSAVVPLAVDLFIPLANKAVPEATALLCQ
jgi:hypothetical protein